MARRGIRARDGASWGIRIERKTRPVLVLGLLAKHHAQAVRLRRPTLYPLSYRRAVFVLTRTRNPLTWRVAPKRQAPPASAQMVPAQATGRVGNGLRLSRLRGLLTSVCAVTNAF